MFCPFGLQENKYFLFFFVFYEKLIFSIFYKIWKQSFNKNFSSLKSNRWKTEKTIFMKENFFFHTFRRNLSSVKTQTSKNSIRLKSTTKKRKRNINLFLTDPTFTLLITFHQSNRRIKRISFTAIQTNSREKIILIWTLVHSEVCFNLTFTFSKKIRPFAFSINFFYYKNNTCTYV